LLQGAGLTIFISITAMLLGVMLGMMVALLSQLRSRAIGLVIQAYVEVFRNTPLLIQIFIVYFGLPQLGLRLSPFLSGLSALTLYTAAYNVEIFRSGLEAVPKGQHEAAHSTGLSPLQEAVHIIIPQALRISFPALGNNLVSLLKNSSLVSTIGMVELMFVANDISFNNFRSFEIYGAAAVLYVVLVMTLTKMMTVIEHRLLLTSSR
ncbi:MAG TPA: amino acid ABC transporter permease, partial [Candidatus Sulfotelmatobacter sp.]|nr:amino acid ABC transporter permease [Candidatus Sulfotelmatobacter sp.]